MVSILKLMMNKDNCIVPSISSHPSSPEIHAIVPQIYSNELIFNSLNKYKFLPYSISNHYKGIIEAGKYSSF